MARVDVDGVKQWMLRTLGAPIVKVELTDDMLDDCIEDARLWFSAKKGQITSFSIQIIPGVNEYTLPSELDIITEVVFPLPGNDLAQMTFNYMLPDQQTLPRDVWSAGSGTMGVYSGITQTLQYLEQAKRVLGNEPDWRQEGTKLYIFPVPKYAGNLLCYSTRHSVTVESLNDRDFDLVKRYSLAKAKERLGRVRSKMDSFPTAQGSVSLDGGTLLGEAQSELQALEEEIWRAGGPMGFISG